MLSMRSRLTRLIVCLLYIYYQAVARGRNLNGGEWKSRYRGAKMFIVIIRYEILTHQKFGNMALYLCYPFPDKNDPCPLVVSDGQYHSSDQTEVAPIRWLTSIWKCRYYRRAYSRSAYKWSVGMATQYVIKMSRYLDNGNLQAVPGYTMVTEFTWCITSTQGCGTLFGQFAIRDNINRLCKKLLFENLSAQQV